MIGVGFRQVLAPTQLVKSSRGAGSGLAAIVESSDDAIISIDLSGIIGTWNSGAEELYGYSAAEVIGRPITILIPSDRADEELGILDRIRHGERIEHARTTRSSTSRSPSRR